MSNKVKQHYVPRFYLKNFSNGKVFNILNIEQGLIENVPYESQCYKNNFYGKDKIYEDKLSKYESKWSVAINKAISNNIELTESDKNTIKQFACFQYCRTVAAYNKRKNMLTNLTEQTVPIICQFYNIQTDKDFAKTFAEQYISSIESVEDAMKQQIDMAENSSASLYDLHFTLLENNTAIGFVTSDNPVVIGNEFQCEYGLGFECIGYYMMFPISPKFYVVISDAKIYPNLKYKDIITIDEKMVEQLNCLQYKNSLINMYSENKINLVKLQNCVKQFVPNIKKEVLDYCNNKTNNFLDVSNKQSLNDLTKFWLDKANDNFFAFLYKQNKNIKLDIFKLLKICEPFTNRLNYNFFRNRTREEIAQRIFLMNYCNSKDFGDAINKNYISSEEKQRVQLFEQFLFAYISNVL